MEKLIVPEGKALVLRCCNPNMTSHGGFEWPKSGPVSCPDWDPKPECGNGLHGWLWGEGCISQGVYPGSDLDSLAWLLVEVEAAEVVDLQGKVKFPRGDVVYCGDRRAAAEHLARLRGADRPILFFDRTGGDVSTVVVADGGTARSGTRGNSVAGDYGTARSGMFGRSTAGEDATAVSGFRGTSSSGYSGTSVSGRDGSSVSGARGRSAAGDCGTAVSGRRGSSVCGNSGAAFSGDFGSSQAGNYGTAVVGLGGRARAGKGGRIVIGHADTTVTCLVGKRRTKPDVWYEFNGSKFVESDVQSPLDPESWVD